MSEYKESHSISKLIGSPAGYVGYNDNKNVFEEVRNKPYSVILLDEIEKCSPNILDLFLPLIFLLIILFSIFSLTGFKS